MTHPATDPDVARFGRIKSMEMLLRVLQRTTGLRVALVARVTQGSWTVCALVDDASFGLQTGDQLDLETTY